MVLGVPVLMLCLLAASFRISRSDAAFNDVTANTGNSLAAAASFSTVFYLHNNPSPPISDTSTQDPLALTTSAPTGTTLYNYSNNYDSGPGRQLQQSALGQSETNDRSVQRWAYPIASDLTISSSSALSIWLAPQNFTPNKTAGIGVGLYDCNAALSSCTPLTSAQTATGPFPTVWTQTTVMLGSINHTFTAGRTLVIKLVPSTSADIDVWLAYDTTTHPSTFTLAP